MADIRIKDLATTASTTASDDFMAVDGTTNGTRKLSAATPSFATSVTVPGVSGPTATNLTLAGGSTGASLVLGQGAGASMSSASKLNLSNTTSASSSTVGALTIGNGTAATNVAIGGGNVNAGGTGTFGTNATGGILRLGGTAPSADSPAEIFLTTSNTAFNWKVLTNTSGPGIFELRQSTAGGGTTFTDAILRITPNVTASASAVGIGGIATIASTTPSTGVGTGALQVAGGIYAGGASYFGGNVNVGSGTAGYAAAGRATVSASGGSSALFGFSVGNATKGYALHTGTDLYLVNEAAGSTFIIGGNNITAITLSSTGAATFANSVSVAGTAGASNTIIWNVTGYNAISFNNVLTGSGIVGIYAASSADNDLFINVPTGRTIHNRVNGTDVFSINSTAATFAGAVAIGNTVNTVSPTSPNRTVTMVIGGVTYYLAAKTTND